MKILKKTFRVLFFLLMLGGVGCGLQSRRELNVANPQGSAGLMNFTQAVTSLEHLTGVDGDSITSLRNYKNLAVAFLSSDGEVLSLTPTYLLVSVGIVGGYCVEGVKQTLTQNQNQRAFLKNSLIGLSSSPAAQVADLTAERASSIATELSLACLERELSNEERSILMNFVSEARQGVAGNNTTQFPQIVAQMCAIVCASFDALRL